MKKRIFIQSVIEFNHHLCSPKSGEKNKQYKEEKIWESWIK